LPLCSSGVILHLSDDHRYRTRGYLAWSPRPRAIDSCLMLLPLPNNRTNSCLLLTKLLADGFVTHSSLVQVYNLISDVLGQLFGLAHCGEVEGVTYDSLDRFLLYTSPVEIRCTLLGRIGLICVPHGHITGLWEPELLLFGRGSNTYFQRSNSNQFITVIKCSFLDVFCGYSVAHC